MFDDNRASVLHTSGECADGTCDNPPHMHGEARIGVPTFPECDPASPNITGTCEITVTLWVRFQGNFGGQTPFGYAQEYNTTTNNNYEVLAFYLPNSIVIL